jgi:hypothetical protein
MTIRHSDRDRGLDNFMLKACSCGESNDEHIHLAAIDNSLSFPHQHPKVSSTSTLSDQNEGLSKSSNRGGETMYMDGCTCQFR